MRYIPLEALKPVKYHQLIDYLLARLMWADNPHVARVYLDNGTCRIVSKNHTEEQMYPTETLFKPSSNHKDCMIWTSRCNVTPPKTTETQEDCQWTCCVGILGPVVTAESELVARCLAYLVNKHGFKIPITEFIAEDTNMALVMAIAQGEEDAPKKPAKKMIRRFDDLV